MSYFDNIQCYEYEKLSKCCSGNVLQRKDFVGKKNVIVKFFSERREVFFFLDIEYYLNLKVLEMLRFFLV